MPCFAGAFRIAVVFLEKTEWFSFICADDNLSLFTGFNRTSVVIDQVYIILRIRESHTAWFRFHPRHGSHGQGGFCLSETFHQFDSGQFLERLEYGRVQRFTCDGTVLQV